MQQRVKFAQVLRQLFFFLYHALPNNYQAPAKYYHEDVHVAVEYEKA